MDVNYIAIAVAAFVGFVIGFVWYLPGVFGKAWMKAVGISSSPQDKQKKKGMGGKIIVSFLSVLLVSFVLDYIIQGMYIWKGNVAGTADLLMIGIYTGFWIWLGFFATSLLDPILWQQKPMRLWFINAGQWLVRLLVMGAILGSM